MSSGMDPALISSQMAAAGHEHFYTVHRARGLHLGPRFRSVSWAWGRDGSAYGVLHVRRPPPVLALRCEKDPDGELRMCRRSGILRVDELEDEFSDEILEYEPGHPALLDGAFQTTFLSRSPVPGAGPDQLPVPFAIERISWRPQQKLMRPVFSHVSPMQDSDGSRHRHTLIYEDVPIIEVQNFEARIVRERVEQVQTMEALAATKKEEEFDAFMPSWSLLDEVIASKLGASLLEEKPRPKPKRVPASAKEPVAEVINQEASHAPPPVLLEDMAIMDAGLNDAAFAELLSGFTDAAPTEQVAAEEATDSATAKPTKTRWVGRRARGGRGSTG